jgi:hypothetical protein
MSKLYKSILTLVFISLINYSSYIAFAQEVNNQSDAAGSLQRSTSQKVKAKDVALEATLILLKRQACLDFMNSLTKSEKYQFNWSDSKNKVIGLFQDSQTGIVGCGQIALPIDPERKEPYPIFSKVILNTPKDPGILDYLSNRLTKSIANVDSGINVEDFSLLHTACALYKEKIVDNKRIQDKEIKSFGEFTPDFPLIVFADSTEVQFFKQKLSEVEEVMRKDGCEGKKGRLALNELLGQAGAPSLSSFASTGGGTGSGMGGAGDGGGGSIGMATGSSSGGAGVDSNNQAALAQQALSGLGDGNRLGVGGGGSGRSPGSGGGQGGGGTQCAPDDPYCEQKVACDPDDPDCQGSCSPLDPNYPSCCPPENPSCNACPEDDPKCNSENAVCPPSDPNCNSEAEKPFIAECTPNLIDQCIPNVYSNSNYWQGTYINIFTPQTGFMYQLPNPGGENSQGMDLPCVSPESMPGRCGTYASKWQNYTANRGLNLNSNLGSQANRPNQLWMN